MRLRAILAAAALLSAGVAAHADIVNGSYSVTVSEGLTGGNGFDTTNGNPFTGPNTASAAFTYTGGINFDNTAGQNGPGTTGDLNSAFGFSGSNISGYSGTGSVVYNSQTIADFGSVSSFLNSSGSASNFDYGSYYTFDLGVLSAGTILSITHDDGVSVYQGSTEVGSATAGPTTVTTDVIDVISTGDTILRYARENGTPSILEVNQLSAAPEPSGLALLGTSLLGFVGVVRKRFR
jgi:hypothetical protein